LVPVKCAVENLSMTACHIRRVNLVKGSRKQVTQIKDAKNGGVFI
jgi:hypothetical protein